MRIIDLEAHFITKDYMKYLRSRKETPREEYSAMDGYRFMVPTQLSA